MDELIQNREDLIQWFNSKRICSKEKNKEVMVSTKIRKEVLTSYEQGTVIIGGEVKRFNFKSLSGGVWLVTLKGLKDA